MIKRIGDVAKSVLPRRIRRCLRAPYRGFLRLRTMYHNFFFRRTLGKILSDPLLSLSQRNVIIDLIYGWGNEGWSSDEEYLVSCVEYTARSKLPILECGSGLTTIVAGLIAQGLGNTVWSLENSPAWASKVQRYLNKYHIESVHLHCGPLKDYGDFSWYNPPLNLMPDRFSLVICDGPTCGTKGGRYGLLPVMKQRLQPGCLILLDDIIREGEQSIVARWSREFRTRHEIIGSKLPYCLISFPESDICDDRSVE